MSTQTPGNPMPFSARARGFSASLLAIVLTATSFTSPASAEFAVEIPALAARSNAVNATGIFTVKLIWWDQAPQPKPVRLQRGSAFINAFEYGNIQSGGWDRSATVNAFRYAVERTPEIDHSGTVNIQGVAYGSTLMDGPSAGAGMAVGFIAVFKQDSLRRGVAMTGTLEPDGSIGPVGGIAGKLRAAAREGYHTVLIPAGQLSDPRWPVRSLALELNVTVREVSTIDEAYALMTTGSL